MLLLVGTPLSHFTRKVRILLAELAIPYEMQWAASVLAPAASAYGGNPLRRLPTLVADGEMLIDSDHIARWLVASFDPGDRFGIRSDRIADLNRFAVIRGVMDNQVVVLLTRRTGGDPDGNPYLSKLVSAIDDGLAWLERDAHDEPAFDYRDLTLVCLWQHLVHYKASGLDRYPQLAARVARFAERPSIAATAPAAALAEAKAAGWSPPS